MVAAVGALTHLDSYCTLLIEDLSGRMDTTGKIERVSQTRRSQYFVRVTAATAAKLGCLHRLFRDWARAGFLAIDFGDLSTQNPGSSCQRSDHCQLTEQSSGVAYVSELAQKPRRCPDVFALRRSVTGRSVVLLWFCSRDQGSATRTDRTRFAVRTPPARFGKNCIASAAMSRGSPEHRITSSAPSQ
jgi:hypothetical protein